MIDTFDLEPLREGEYYCKRYINIDEYSIVNNAFVTIEFTECSGLIELILENGEKYRLLNNHKLHNLTERNFKIRVKKNSKLNIKFTSEKLYDFNSTNIHKISNSAEDLYYKVEGNIINPQKILFTFPFNSADLESTSRFYDIDRSDLLDIQIIDSERNWLQNKEQLIVELINKLCIKYKLEEKDIIIAGSSKGGTLTLKFGKLVPDAKKIAITPLISKADFLTLILQSSNIDIPMFYLKDMTIAKESPDSNTLIITDDTNYDDFENTIKIKTNSENVFESHITARKLGIRYTNYLINESIGNAFSRNYLNNKNYVSDNKFEKELVLDEVHLLKALNMIEIYNNEYHKKVIVEYVSGSSKIDLDLSDFDIDETDNISHSIILKSKENLISNSYRDATSLENPQFYKVNKAYKYINIDVVKGNNYGKNIILENGEYDILGIKDRQDDVLKNNKFYSIPTKYVKGLLSNLGVFDVKYSNEIIFTEEQEAYNTRHNVKCDVINDIPIYFTENNVESPEKILFTFAGVHAANNVPYVMSAMTSFKQKMKAVKVIALMDVNEYLGKYLHKFNGEPMRPSVDKLIGYYIKKYNLSEEQVYFYGNSKGASTAIQFIDVYPNSKFILDIPQLSIKSFIKPRPLLQQIIFGEVNFEYVDYLKKLNNNNIYYTFAEFDSDNTCDEFDYDGINTCLAIGTDHGSIGKIVPKSVELVISNNIIVEDYNHCGNSDILIEEKDCIAIELCRYNTKSKVYSSILLEKNENKYFCEYDKYRKYVVDKLTNNEKLQIIKYK